MEAKDQRQGPSGNRRDGGQSRHSEGVTVHRTLIKVATAYQINKYKRGGGVHASASLEAGSKILGWGE